MENKNDWPAVMVPIPPVDEDGNCSSDCPLLGFCGIDIPETMIVNDEVRPCYPGWPGPNCPRHPDYKAPVDRLAEATEILRDMVACKISECVSCGMPYDRCSPDDKLPDRARRFLEEGKVKSE